MNVKYYKTKGEKMNYILTVKISPTLPLAKNGFEVDIKNCKYSADEILNRIEKRIKGVF